VEKTTNNIKKIIKITFTCNVIICPDERKGKQKFQLHPMGVLLDMEYTWDNAVSNFCFVCVCYACTSPQLIGQQTVLVHL